MNQTRVYPVTIAQGATVSTSQYVGNADRVYLYHSGTTAFNSAAGNVTFQLVGNVGTETRETALTPWPILSAVIATDTSGGFYNWPVNVGGVPRLSVTIGTAATAAATLYLLAVTTG